MINNTEIKVWHLLLFYFFFSFAGSFLALYSGVGKATENIIEVMFSVFYMVFLLFLLPDIKKFIFGFNLMKFVSAIIIGVISGLLLWYIMVLWVPLRQLTLASCELEICNNLLNKYYTFNSTGSMSDISKLLLFSMIMKFVFIGPIREELLYRAAMSTLLFRRYSILTTSLIIAIIFAVLHLRYFVFTMANSLMFSALVLKYRNILPAVIAHGTYNCTIYFLYPSKTIVGHYSNLSMFEIALVLLLLGNIFYWSCHVIKRHPLDWLEPPPVKE